MLEKVKNLRLEKREDDSLYGSSEYAAIKLTTQSYCSACGKEFQNMELCFWTSLDNSIVCQNKKCTEPHAELELRLFIRS